MASFGLGVDIIAALHPPRGSLRRQSVCCRPGCRAGRLATANLGTIGAHLETSGPSRNAREGPDREVLPARAFGAALTEAKRVQRVPCFE
jgi:hypothetical protein